VEPYSVLTIKMAKILKTTFLGTTKKLLTKKQLAKKRPGKPTEGCLFIFDYRSRTATDPKPFIIMISPKWVARKGGTYFTGVNLNDLKPKVRKNIISHFGKRPVGSVSYHEIVAFSDDDPACCVRTYSVNKVRALHKVEV